MVLAAAVRCQDHRGSIAWVSEAFGAKWGFVDAVWSLATSFLDNALYPIIISDFLGLTGTFRWVFIYACIVLLTWAVYRGSSVSASSPVHLMIPPSPGDEQRPAEWPRPCQERVALAVSQSLACPAWEHQDLDPPCDALRHGVR